MSSDYKGKSAVKTPHVYASFRHAYNGFLQGVKEERNLRIHLVMTAIVIVLGYLLNIHPIEWILLLLTIGIVIGLEMLNSAIERVVDLVTSEYHPLAKTAKDMGAAAVFFFAILSVIIGLIIFLPKIVLLF